MFQESSSFLRLVQSPLPILFDLPIVIHMDSFLMKLLAGHTNMTKKEALQR